MEMFWKPRRRPSRFAMFVRSFLMVGAAVGVPVGLEVIRRMVRSRRSGAAGHAMDGRGKAVPATSRRGSRARRPGAIERTSA